MRYTVKFGIVILCLAFIEELYASYLCESCVFPLRQFTFYSRPRDLAGCHIELHPQCRQCEQM